MFAGASGCLASASEGQLTSRASFDLSCPAETLRYKRIDGRTQGVLGCGKRAIYVESCDGPRSTIATDCTWVINGGIELTEPPPAPAAAPPAGAPALGPMPSNAATPLPPPPAR
jgi:hypothetical protein